MLVSRSVQIVSPSLRMFIRRSRVFDTMDFSTKSTVAGPQLGQNISMWNKTDPLSSFQGVSFSRGQYPSASYATLALHYKKTCYTNRFINSCKTLDLIRRKSDRNLISKNVIQNLILSAVTRNNFLRIIQKFVME